ncbi:YaaL family protein [Priestia koreensis]|uniref:DUF2508 domain-containing protein n=1 Tax=Priestia koreensis TaxID=284581 RepID=A0A0M0L767_9BACI|nr:YaaL family protein [Priestia koreensis]KOO46722.1 hypothetical protein AMD01_09010 [Priestia koreensis]MCM3007117.1 YaaL family protein [Priestia koreensis]UNL85052.1 YaaL family protein [Priestia koreensis]
MLFKRKGWLRKEFDQELLNGFNDTKAHWLKQSRYIEQSVDPSEDVLVSMKVAKAKYLYLLKEAKHRNISNGKM